MAINECLSELLKEHSMSADALARQIGLSGSIVRRWRRKTPAIKLEHLLRVAEYFKCSLDFLCGRVAEDKGFNKEAKPNFAAKIKTVIAESKIPIERVSKETEIDRSNIYDWLNGVSMPTTTSLIRLAEYFKCTIDYLVGLE